MKAIRNLWMNAHVARWMDSQVTLAGNDQDATAVIETIYFCLSAMGKSADFADNPTREEIVQYLIDEGREHEIEYLMENY